MACIEQFSSRKSVPKSCMISCPFSLPVFEGDWNQFLLSVDRLSSDTGQGRLLQFEPNSEWTRKNSSLTCSLKVAKLLYNIKELFMLIELYLFFSRMWKYHRIPFQFQKKYYYLNYPKFHPTKIEEFMDWNKMSPVDISKSSFWRDVLRICDANSFNTCIMKLPLTCLVISLIASYTVSFYLFCCWHHFCGMSRTCTHHFLSGDCFM